MSQQLVEEHGFRQTQTAMTAVDFQRYGIDLLHPRVPVFGTRAEVPFEFPLFQAMATVPMNLGLDADMAMRVTAFACFLLTAVLLYGLIRRVGGRVAALASLVAFLFSPFGLLWGRTSLVEYLATAGAVGFARAGIEWRERRHWAFVVLAVLAGSVAMLVKITTGVFWILPLVLYTAVKELPGFRRVGARPARPRVDRGDRPAAARGRLVDAPRRRDQGRELGHRLAHQREPRDLELRHARPTPGRGELDDHLRSHRAAARRAARCSSCSSSSRLGRAQAEVLARAHARRAAPTVVFFNLYWAHDYYLAAISTRARRTRRRGGRLGVGTPAASLVGAGVRAGARHAVARLGRLAGVGLLREDERPRRRSVRRCGHRARRGHRSEQARGLHGRGVEPDDAVLRGSSRLHAHVADRVAAAGGQALSRRSLPILLLVQPYADPIHVLSAWKWIGVLGPRTYVVGQHREDVDHTPVYASTAPTGSTEGTRTAIPCDGERVAIPGSGSPTTISAPRNDDLRILVGRNLAPFPRVATLYSRERARSVATASPPSRW